MGLEVATSISDLVTTNPPGTDQKKQGDDHLRLIKSVLQYCFPNATKPYYIPTSKAKSANYTVLEAEENCVIVCDTTIAFTLTLPVLDTSNDGWCCYVLKTTTDANPVFIAPPSGTINGYTKVRRAVPYIKTKITWTGSVFVADRAVGVPIGSRIPFHGTTLPPGYLWPDGTTFTAADFVELNTVLGGNTKPDLRGRIGLAQDDLGGTAAGRVTTAGSGVDGATLGAIGGAQNVTLTTAEIPAHSHANTLGDTGHSHALGKTSTGTANFSYAGSTEFALSGGIAVGRTEATTSNITISNVNAGGGTAHNNMPPVLVQNELLVAE